MPNKYKNITRLIIKKIDNEISPTELAKLDAWAAGSPFRQRYVREVEEVERTLRDTAASHEWDWKSAWNEMVEGEPDLHAVPEEEEEEEDPALRQPGLIRKLWRRIPSWAAAASIAFFVGGLLLLGGVVLFRSGPEAVTTMARGPGLKVMPRGQPAHAPPAPLSLAATLRPGIWKARLQRADRQTIDLASEPVGPIGIETGISIEKISDSAISYDPASAAGKHDPRRVSDPASNVGDHPANGSNAASAAGKHDPHQGGDPASSMALHEISTPRGAQFQVVLPDGSKVWLGAATRIRFPPVFRSHTRDVVLDGEAFFEVRQMRLPGGGGNIPFIVHTGMTNFEVTGTRFSVMAYNEDKDVMAILVVGAIKVHESIGQGKDSPPMSGFGTSGSPAFSRSTRGRSVGGRSVGGRSIGGRSVAMLPGQQYTRDNEGHPGTIASIDTTSGLSLTRGEFHIKNKPIRQIMQQVSRWYDADIHYRDSIPGNYTLTGDRQEPVDKLLKSLEATGGIHFDVQGRQIIVSAR